MRQVGVGVVKGQETRGAGWVFFCSLLTKPEGISNKMGEKRGISNEPAEMCLVCMGIGSQQRDLRHSAVMPRSRFISSHFDLWAVFGSGRAL